LSRHPRSSAWRFGPLVALGLASCVSGFDRNDQLVTGLRILGAAAHIDNGDGVDWADAEVGDKVTLSALVANPTGVADVTVTWVTCLPSLQKTVTPCTSTTVLRNPADLITMADDPSTGVIKLGVGETIEYTVPQEVGDLTDQLIMRADQNLNAQCAIFIQAPVIIIVQGGGAVVTAVKNLRLSPWSQIGPADKSNPALQGYVRNANPTLDALNIPPDKSACVGQTLVASCQSDSDCGGAACSADGWCPPVEAFPAGNQLTCGHLRDSQTDPATGADVDVQTFYYCGLDGVDGSQMEYPTITWYSTGGGQSSVANSNTAGTPDLASRTFINFTRPPGPFTLYGVVRDGRDGENWIAQTFQ
jgi:hypothetical protein